MKKSLIALAVLGAFAGVGTAQAADSVQLYGIIDLGVTHFTGLKPAGTGTGTVSSTGLSSGVQSGSRIGVKGKEDLGGGLSAIFTAETGFCAAGTNQNQGTVSPGSPAGGFCTGGGFMQRQAFAGLTGGFGTLVAGRMYTPVFNAEANVADPFGWGLTGTMGNISIVGQLGLARANQAVAYVSPSFGGFTVTGAYSFAPLAAGTVPTASGVGSNVPRAGILQGQYANGPITAGLSYLMATNIMINSGGVNDGKASMWQAYGAYDLGVAKLSAIYERASSDYVSGNLRFWSLGATVPVGPGAILASYGNFKSSWPAVAGSNTVLSSVPQLGNPKQWAIGYTYALSKRTNLYASYARITNDTNTALAVGSSTDSNKGVAGQNSNGIALGIRHQF